MLLKNQWVNEEIKKEIKNTLRQMIMKTQPLKIYGMPQKTQNCQSNPEKQKPSRGHNSPRLQEILQSHSHQNSVVLVSKQTDRPMQQKREPGNKP